MRALCLLASMFLVAGCDGSGLETDAGSYVYGDVPLVESASYEAYRAERERVLSILSEQVSGMPASSVRECGLLPLGEQACGGPHGEVVYATAAPGTAAAIETGARLLGLDRYANRTFDVVAPCELYAEVRPALVGGRCVAAE